MSFRPFSLQAKMALQGKQMGVGAREAFAYDAVKLVYWPTVTGMRLIPRFFFFFSKW
jgi:hypothetical protein